MLNILYLKSKPNIPELILSNIRKLNISEKIKNINLIKKFN